MNDKTFAQVLDLFDRLTDMLDRVVDLTKSELERLDNELGEMRDGMIELDHKIASTNRVLQSRTEHLA